MCLPAMLLICPTPAMCPFSTFASVITAVKTGSFPFRIEHREIDKHAFDVYRPPSHSTQYFHVHS